MYVEVGYKIYEGMPVYPGLPEVKVTSREQISKGDGWNGSVLSMYLHAGTHADAPWHYVSEAFGIDKVPIESFIYKKPLLITIPWKENDLITIDDLKMAGKKLYEADIIFLNTGHWKFREEDFDKYKDNFPALSPEAAEYIRNTLINVKAVAIDTLSIENLGQGAKNGYMTHNTLLSPHISDTRTIVIIEDYNPEPIIGRKLLFAFASPLRIVDRDATPINVIVECE